MEPLSTLTCPTHGHQLRALTFIADHTFTCDSCGKPGVPQDHARSIGCGECHYDMCYTCVGDARPVAEKRTPRPTERLDPSAPPATNHRQRKPSPAARPAPKKTSFDTSGVDSEKLEELMAYMDENGISPSDALRRLKFAANGKKAKGHRKKRRGSSSDTEESGTLT